MTPYCSETASPASFLARRTVLAAGAGGWSALARQERGHHLHFQRKWPTPPPRSDAC